MQTILGANGVIGRELSRRLPQYADRIRQVSRSPKPVNTTDELFTADLLDAKATGCGPLATVLGVRPAEPAFTTVRIEPHLGRLQRAEGRVPHPSESSRCGLSGPASADFAPRSHFHQGSRVCWRGAGRKRPRARTASSCRSETPLVGDSPFSHQPQPGISMNRSHDAFLRPWPPCSSFH
jgi:hypothetical protein